MSIGASCEKSGEFDEKEESDMMNLKQNFYGLRK